MAAVIGSIIGGVAAMNSWLYIPLALIVGWVGFRLTNYGAQLALWTALVALVWNDNIGGDYDFVDLGINTAMAAGLMRVIR